MRIKAMLKIIGIVLALFSLSMLPPIPIGLIYQDYAVLPFIFAFILTLFFGGLLWFICRDDDSELKVRDGFLIVTLFWVVVSLFAALPFLFAKSVSFSFTDGYFEAVSALTTTGATIMYNLDKLPHSILFYRQELQFIGGMGIVVLALAVLPMLGIGGMSLYRAEVPGPMKDTKLKPRLTETAKALWYIYVGLTILCVLCYWGSGMDLFHAVGESFSTISTGGFSMHDANFAYYHSTAINLFGIIFMILGSINFSLHFLAVKGLSPMCYLRDVETKTYLAIIAFVSIVCCLFLVVYRHEHLYFSSVVRDVFDVVSIASTTGLVASNFAHWPHFLPILMMTVAIVGGCAGSTAGGIKVIRFILLWKISLTEGKRLIHTNAVLPIKVNDNILSRQIIDAVFGFVAIYLFLFIVLLFLLMVSGLNFVTAFGALAACISSAGASIAGVAGGFESISDPAKWILVLAMIAGRLEIFTLFVIFLPKFWKY